MIARRKQNKWGVRERAEEIRKSWTLPERAKRLGLPPDMPKRLHEYLIGRPVRTW